MAGGPNPKRTQKNINYSVHMMERKTMNNVITFIPFPCFYQRTNLGSDKMIKKTHNDYPTIPCLNRFGTQLLSIVWAHC